MISFLVTGAAGDIGYNICRILREQYSHAKIICTDVTGDVPYQNISASFSLLPRANDENYIRELSALIERHNVQHFLPTSEPELRFLTEIEDFLPEIISSKIIWASRSVRLLGFDKLATSNFLRDYGFAHLAADLDSDGLPKVYPCIYKSRFGAGSDAVFRVANSSEAKLYQELYPNYIWQTYATSKYGEFTACLFSDGFRIRSLILKRTLSAGVSRTARVVSNPDYTKYIEDIGKKLEFAGSINVQFRIVDKIPHVFEINPRFSSTVKMRDIIGFKDLIWSIESKDGRMISPYILNPNIHEKTLYRLNNEYIQ